MSSQNGWRLVRRAGVTRLQRQTMYRDVGAENKVVVEVDLAVVALGR